MIHNIIMACRRGDIAVVRRLVQSGADVRVHFDLPLVEACRHGYADIVRILLDHSGMNDVPLPAGYVAILEAAKRGRLSVVRLLLERGVPCRGDLRRMCLVQAGRNGHFDVVLLLLDRPIAGDVGLEILLDACIHGHIGVVRRLLQEDPMVVDVRSDSGHAALIQAMRRGYDDIVLLLIEHGASVRVADSFRVVMPEEEDDAVCPICHSTKDEIDDVWCITPCGHLHCRPCLMRWTATDSGHRAVVPCPVCRHDLLPALRASDM